MQSPKTRKRNKMMTLMDILREEQNPSYYLQGEKDGVPFSEIYSDRKIAEYNADKYPTSWLYRIKRTSAPSGKHMLEIIEILLPQRLTMFDDSARKKILEEQESLLKERIPNL